MINYLIILFVLFATPSLAQEANPTIRIEKSACRYLTKHVPDADVEYKSGVSANGKKVVPADIAPPENYGLEDSFNLRLTTDAVRAFGLNVPSIQSNNPYSDPNAAGVTTDTAFGTIKLKHGKAYLNGRPLDPAGERQLAILCKSQHKSEQ